jgi:hypothetical protein
MNEMKVETKLAILTDSPLTSYSGQFLFAHFNYKASTVRPVHSLPHLLSLSLTFLSRLPDLPSLLTYNDGCASITCGPISMDATESRDPLTNYHFPSDRLSRTLRDSSKEPIVLVACGSFSPLTYLHLRIFEMAADYVRQSTDFEIMGGYLSPVSDMYKKPGLLSANHRSVSVFCEISFVIDVALEG